MAKMFVGSAMATVSVAPVLFTGMTLYLRDRSAGMTCATRHFPLFDDPSMGRRALQVLVVCARNRRLYDSLKQKNYSGVHVFGFVDDMDELMSLSHLIVTKAGGMTIAESLSKDLVPLFMMAIPGQERENVRILSLYGIGCLVKETDQVRDLILDYKLHPQKLSIAKENIHKVKHPHALEEICRVVCPGRSGCAC